MDFKAVIQECFRKSQAGEIMFSEVVQKLIAAGVETYHVDYIRGETTYYTASDETHIEMTAMPDTPPAQNFSASDVAAAVRGAQRGEIKYKDFIAMTFAAGCVGYLACLRGKRVIYLGRTGDSHTEHFPQ